MDPPDDERTVTDRTVGEGTVIDPSPVDGGLASGVLTAGTEFAGYVIEDVAGRGGMGVVYRARQRRPSRIVALKVISPVFAGDAEFRTRFADESEIAASIEHSNVIPVYDAGESSGLLYIAMRYVEGTDLRTVLGAEGRLAPDRATEILAQLTSALDAAHARGLVHRDVKPGNVLIAREGRQEHVYLTDFGLAKLAASGGKTRTGMFVGTLDYAAPEQLEGGRVDARTDVYSAGCLLFQMLTGSVPFPQEHEAAIMWAHISTEPRSVRELVPDLPAGFDAVIARAMAKNPDDRYPSAGDLGRDAIAAAQGGRTTLVERSVATGRAAPATPGRSGPRPSRRLAALGVAAVLGVAIIILAVGGVFGGSSSPHPPPSTPAAKKTVPAPTTKTYTNASLDISFSYPASWQPLVLKGAIADFGIENSATETRCALVIERGAGPAGNSQEAQFEFVRQRSATAAREDHRYQLLAINAEQGVNISGVGLLRVAGGQGGHLGFFFRGRDVYIFDCITPAASLTAVDRQAFQPLFASLRVG